MGEIKFGQVLKYGNKIFVITAFVITAYVEKEYSGNSRIYVLYNNGHSLFYSLNFLCEKFEVLAEYPTWQEAVASKEFNPEMIKE